MIKVKAVLLAIVILGVAGIVIASVGQSKKDESTASVVNAQGAMEQMHRIEGAMDRGLIVPIDFFEDLYRFFMKLSLPDSLDKWYEGSKPETPSSEWVGEMFIQAGAFDGMVANIQEGDLGNATIQYDVFAGEYKKISKKVPEWKGYFNIAAVDQLGEDLNDKNIPAAFNDIGKIGATCQKCMGERRAQVWAKYYWRSFDTVDVSTSNGNLSWVNAMQGLGLGYEGIAADAMKGDQAATNNSFNQFKALYKDVGDACKNCHDTPRFYYVSPDVFAEIDQMGANITANDLPAVMENQRDLGIQCYKCHVLHMPAEDMKDKMGE